MEQKFMLLVYYKGVAPMEQEIRAVHQSGTGHPRRILCQFPKIKQQIFEY